jgi:hypothetical protein
VAPPVGPTGLRYCSGDDADLRWRVGAAGTFADTRLTFSTGGGTLEAAFTHWALTASVDRRLGDRWTLGGFLGATVAGSLDAGGVVSSSSPGPLGGIAASFRPLDEGPIAPFVLLGASAAASLAWTTLPGGTTTTLSAFDVRLSAVAGKTILQAVTPYVLARAFGGPVYWSLAGESATGTDAYHYQAGVGLVVRAGRVDVVVEGAPLGERAIVLGVGLAL